MRLVTHLLSVFSLIIAFILTSCSFEVADIETRNIMVLKGQEWLTSLCCERFAGRRAGTDGNRLAGEYIKNEIEKCGFSPVVQDFVTENGMSIRNIIVTIPGRTDSTLIVGAHYDGPLMDTEGRHYQAAEDNASGAVALLLLLKSFEVSPLNIDRTVLCCFWDSEEVNDGIPFRGSTHFAESLNELEKSYILLYQNLDTVGHNHDGNNEIYLQYLGGGNRVKVEAERIAQNGRFVYHVSPKKTFESDYTSFYNVGIPFLCYYDHRDYICENPQHTTLDTQDAISIERLIRVANNVRETVEIF